jgi:hypothetical protein
VRILVLLAIIAAPARAAHLVSDPYPAGPLQPAQFTLICTTGPNPQIDFPSSINAQGRYFVNFDLSPYPLLDVYSCQIAVSSTIPATAPCATTLYHCQGACCYEDIRPTPAPPSAFQVTL